MWERQVQATVEVMVAVAVILVEVARFPEAVMIRR